MKRIITILAVLIVLAALVLAIFKQIELSPSMNGNGSSSSSDMMNSSSGTMTSSKVAAAKETLCGDAKDNDADTLKDCDDPDCAGNSSCRCSALSCGDTSKPGSEFTCRSEEGCICNSARGCEACHTREQACDTTADCCGGTGLTCQEVLIAGKYAKQCRPSAVLVCDITCEDIGGGKGQWGRTENCGTAYAPGDAVDCETLTGTCELAPTASRNVRKCWKS